jgi:hypothetical protein
MKILLISVFLFLLTASCSKDNNSKENVEVTPSQIQLIFPENVSECIEGSIISATQSEVVFKWGPLENTDLYEVHITNLFLSETRTYSTQNTQLPITIQRGTPYSWYISSPNNPVSLPSDSWSFYNSGNQKEYFIPFPAQNIQPENGTILTPNQNSVILEWLGNDLDSDILEYDVYFDEKTPPTLYQEKFNENNITINTLISGKKYYWSITTRDVLGNESNSNIFTFDVE